MDDSPPSGPIEQELALLRQQLAALRFDLSGKDWLTVDEAAHYCGVSRSQFDARAPDYGLQPRNFMGKKLYEKSQLYQAILSATGWGGAPTTTSPASALGYSPAVTAALNKLSNPTKQRRSK